MKLIVYIFLINVILFLPRYVLGLPRNWNPLRFIWSNDTIKHKLKSIYYSRIIDPFRFSMEYTWLILFMYILGFQGDTANVLLTITAVMVFIFNIYSAVFLVLLKKTPILKSDWFFLKESLSIYKGYFLVIALGAILFIAIVASLFYYLNRFALSLEWNNIYGIALLVFILANGFYNIKYYNITDYLSRVVFSIIIFSIKSTKQTKKYNQIFKLSKEEIQKHNHFTELKFKEKPNIHIISMESYGSVLFQNESEYGEISNLVRDWADEFQKAGIKCRTSYAVPPLFATGTWYSYSTLLFGMTIENGAKQNILFSEMANFEAYESLFQLTKREGYTNFLLQGMIGEFEGTLDFKRLKKNLNYDELIYNKSLEYDGQLLKFMNLQNCVPDQYTFNKGLDIAQQTNDPYTLFYCTLNSHWDFYAPLELADDWRKIATPEFTYETTLGKDWSRVERYKASMKYTINAIMDTIKKRIKNNDIYIVYGDHQPTMITDEKYGKNTPIHIFSQNEEFLEAWSEYGFEQGLFPQENENPIQFEGLYSALVRTLNKVYGEDNTLELPFLKNGIQLID